jgi:hypothetical protein
MWQLNIVFLTDGPFFSVAINVYRNYEKMCGNAPASLGIEYLSKEIAVM